MSPATILSKQISNGSIDTQCIVLFELENIRIRNIINPISSLQSVFHLEPKQVKVPGKGISLPPFPVVMLKRYAMDKSAGI